MPTPIPPPTVQLQTPTEVYDSLMREIEPELLSTELPNLEKRYAKESADARKERYARYDRAFQKYDEGYATYVRGIEEETHNYRRAFLQSAEEESREEDATGLTKLESAFTS